MCESVQQKLGHTIIYHHELSCKPLLRNFLRIHFSPGYLYICSLVFCATELTIDTILPRIVSAPQHDGVRTTMKKGTPKILSKSISRVPMGSLVGH